MCFHESAFMLSICDDECAIIIHLEWGELSTPLWRLDQSNSEDELWPRDNLIQISPWQWTSLVLFFYSVRTILAHLSGLCHGWLRLHICDALTTQKYWLKVSTTKAIFHSISSQKIVIGWYASDQANLTALFERVLQGDQGFLINICENKYSQRYWDKIDILDLKSESQGKKKCGHYW